MSEPGAHATPLRREPPAWIPVDVTGRDVLGSHMVRVCFEGDGLRSMSPPSVASSVRLLIDPDGGTPEIPTWAGNEFLLRSGARPVIRTFTPLRFDADAGTLDLEIMRHEGGAVSTWAEEVTVGTHAAISGPGRAHGLDTNAPRHLLLGDETALPAMAQILDALSDRAPSDSECEVHVELVSTDGHVTLPEPRGTAVTYHQRDPGEAPGHRLVDVVAAMDAIAPGTEVWAAGEAAAMHAVRKHVLGRLGLDRSHATIRGYWKRAH